MAIEKYNWLRDLVSLHQQSSDSDEFWKTLKQIYLIVKFMFYPKGRSKKASRGSTPIDFAFAIHTDIGQRIVAAQVNGKLVSIKHRLENGDNVEVITSKVRLLQRIG